MFSYQELGVPENPYAKRLKIDFGLFSLRFHYWMNSDDPRAYHDHAHWFFTLVLWGGYDDLSEDGTIDRLGFGSIRFRKARHRHTVQLTSKRCFTILLAGPQERRWSFYFKNKRYRRDRYFAEQGHYVHGGDPIRLRPDGTRINK